jgi:hypothetical protein
METYTESKPFVKNSQFIHQRENSLKNLDIDSIDKPIKSLISGISELDYCFTLQSCYGHFIHEEQKDNHNTDPLPSSVGSGEIEYRIAYIALCLDNNQKGKELFRRLKKLPSIDRCYIQFGCANWFWEQQVNSFILQVEPERFKFKDTAIVAYKEALHLERIRNEFFIKLNSLFPHPTK